MEITNIWNALSEITKSFANAGNWLITPFWNGISPLMLMSFAGLGAFLVVALVKWLVS